MSAADWYADAITHFSATSDGYHFVMASDELKEMYGPTNYIFLPFSPAHPFGG